MSHDHDHDHAGHLGHDSATRADHQKRLAWTLALTSTYLIAEIVGGLWTNSLALLADAAHMLADVASLALAFFAIWLAGRPAPAHRTFGYHRAEILAALVNGALLLAACAGIFWEAVERLIAPESVVGLGMLVIATGGLIANLIALKILHGAAHANLNMRGVWLHVLADLLGSVAAMLGAIGIWLFGWIWLDPVVSMLISLLVLRSAWNLVGEATGVLMESVPRGIDIDEVRDAIHAVPGVAGLHDLHIWSITSGRVCLSVHIEPIPLGDADNAPTSPQCGHHAQLLGALQKMLKERFGITHTTIQIDPADISSCGVCELQ